MKTIRFIILTAVIALLSVGTYASAQVLPVTNATTLKGQITPTAPIKMEIVNPVVNHSKDTLVTHMTPSDAVTVLVAGKSNESITHLSEMSTVHYSVDTLNVDQLAITSEPTTVIQNSVPDVTPTQVPTPTHPSNGTTVVSGTGKYYGNGMYGAQVQPVAQALVHTDPVTQSAPRVIYKTVYKNAPAKEPIPLLDEGIDDAQVVSSKTRIGDSQYGASTFGIRGISLAGVLTAIAVILVIMVAIQEYTTRKRYQQVHAHEYA